MKTVRFRSSLLLIYFCLSSSGLWAGNYRPSGWRITRWLAVVACAGAITGAYDTILKEKHRGDLFLQKRLIYGNSAGTNFQIVPGWTRWHLLKVTQPDKVSIEVYSDSDELEIVLIREHHHHPFYCEEVDDANRPPGVRSEFKYKYFPTIPFEPGDAFEVKVSNPKDKTLRYFMRVPEGVEHQPGRLPAKDENRNE